MRVPHLLWQLAGAGLCAALLGLWWHLAPRVDDAALGSDATLTCPASEGCALVGVVPWRVGEDPTAYMERCLEVHSVPTFVPCLLPPDSEFGEPLEAVAAVGWSGSELTPLAHSDEAEMRAMIALQCCHLTYEQARRMGAVTSVR